MNNWCAIVLERFVYAPSRLSSASFRHGHASLLNIPGETWKINIKEIQFCQEGLLHIFHEPVWTHLTMLLIRTLTILRRPCQRILAVLCWELINVSLKLTNTAINTTISLWSLMQYKPLGLWIPFLLLRKLSCFLSFLAHYNICLSSFFFFFNRSNKVLLDVKCRSAFDRAEVIGYK